MTPASESYRDDVARTLGGPIALFWSNGIGPSKEATHSVIEAAGARVDASAPNKESMVRQAFVALDGGQARHLAQELVDLLYASGDLEEHLSANRRRVERLRSALARVAATLDDSGEIKWAGEVLDSRPSIATLEPQVPEVRSERINAWRI